MGPENSGGRGVLKGGGLCGGGGLDREGPVRLDQVAER